jgi:hypothetical protein
MLQLWPYGLRATRWLHAYAVAAPACTQTQLTRAQVHVRVTFEAGDTYRLVSEVLAQHHVDTVVACGGDGTVTEVVETLLARAGGASSALRALRALQHTAPCYVYLPPCRPWRPHQQGATGME